MAATVHRTYFATADGAPQSDTLFAVLINGTVKIDDLSIHLAKMRSGTFRVLFSLPDSAEMRMVEQGEPIPLNISCYDEDSTVAESISESLLRRLFGRFRQDDAPAPNPGDDTLRGWYHGLQIASFMDMQCREPELMRKVFSEYPLHDIVAAIRPLYSTLHRSLRVKVMREFAQTIHRTHFYGGGKRVVGAACCVMADLVLQGVDFAQVLGSTYEGLFVTNYRQDFFRWHNKDVALTRERGTRADIARFLDVGRGVRMAFIFGTLGNRLAHEPFGWVFFQPKRDPDIELNTREYTRANRDEWEFKGHSIDISQSIGTSLSFPLLQSRHRLLAAGCVRPDNPYEDLSFVQEVCEVLRITLEEIKAKA